MKTKRQHLKSLRDVKNDILTYLLRGDKEGHIPNWMLRIWGSNIKSAANFLERELKKEKKN